jgi:hypothetical protein
MPAAFDREYYRKHEDVERYPSIVENVECFYKKQIRGYTVLCFEGRKSKASLVKFADNMHEVILYIETYVASKCRANQTKEIQKQKNKILKKENIEKCQPGDIYMTYWGYEQTNVSFFQVISKPSPSSVIVQQVNQKIEETGYMSGKTTPIYNGFKGEPKRCTFNRNGTQISNIDEYSHPGFKYDHKSEIYISWGY